MPEPAPQTAPTPVGARPDRPDPSFAIVSVEALAGSSVPTLRFHAQASDPSGLRIQFITLSILFTIEPGLRSYDEDSRERLVELFGEPERWGSTTGAFRWTQAETVVPAFTGNGGFRFAVECSYDHEIAATKYFAGAGEGAYPLRLHFNGATYYEDGEGRSQILPLAWDRSTRFELPASVWRQMIDQHYPRGGWLRLSEETLGELGRYKAASGAPTADACVRELLRRARSGEGRD